MFRDVLENAIQRSCAQRIVIRHRDVMLASLLRREPEMPAFLPRHRIPEQFETLGQLRREHIPR